MDVGAQTRLRNRVVAALLAVVLVTMLGILAGWQWLQYRVLEEEIARLGDRVRLALDQDTRLTLDLFLAHGQALLAQPGVLAAVAAGDRARLLDLAGPAFEHLRRTAPSLDVMHFHGADNVTLLRVHKPDMYGDDLTRVRPMIARANRDRRTLSGFEIGKNGISYRVTLPMFDGERFLGTLELGLTLGHFSQRLAGVFGVETGVALIRAAMRPYLEQHGEAGFVTVRDYVLPNTTPQSLVAEFKAALEDPRPFLITEAGGRPHVLLKHLTVRNYQGEPVALLLVSEDVGTRLGRLSQYTAAIVALVMCGVTVAATLFYWVFGRLLRAHDLDRLRLRLATQGADEGLWDLDLATDTLYSSARMREIFGFTPDDGPERRADWEALIDPEDVTRVRQTLARHLDGGLPQFRTEYRARHRDGRPLWISLRGQRVDDRQGRPTRVLGLISDITQEKEMAERIRHMAQHDPLTGLANRALFSDLMRQALANAKRDVTGLAVLLIDLDGFKPINDRLGHAVGDLVLIEAARRISGGVRDSDTVARLGGDEFVVLLRLHGDSHKAMFVAGKILASVRQPYAIEGQPIKLSCSIGVALYPDHGTNEIELTRRADAAMYQAKQAGGDGVRMCEG